MPTESYTEEDYKRLKIKTKRELIKEMAREIYCGNEEISCVQDAVVFAKHFYDNIEAELDKVLEKDGEE
jgi:hypothetical protein